MNKKLITGVLAGALSLSLLAGCGASGSAASSDKVIKVGATPTPHAEILNACKDILAEQGYELQVTEFTDYIQPNVALNDGTLDANYFQHEPYLNKKVQEEGYKLVSAGGVHYEPFALYPGKTKAIADLKDGAEITVPNDDTNETRALMLLESQGLIKMAEGKADPTQSATVLDIVENPKNLKITEVAAEQLSRSLQDVDMSVINGNYALQAGLNANTDALAVEDGKYAGVYVNVVAVREGEENSPKIKALMDALHSDTVKKYIDDTYKGAVVPTF